MTNKIGCAILIPKKENRNEAIFMRKKMIGKACAAALIAGMMFAEGCGNAGGTDTENTALQKEETDTQAQADAAGETQYPLTITDDLGNKVGDRRGAGAGDFSVPGEYRDAVCSGRR